MQYSLATASTEEGLDFACNSAVSGLLAVALQRANQKPLFGSLRRNVHVFDPACGCRNTRAVFPHTVEMKLDSLTNFYLNFGGCCTCSDAPRKIGNVYGKISLRFFYHYRVTHRFLISSAQLARGYWQAFFERQRRALS